MNPMVRRAIDSVSKMSPQYLCLHCEDRVWRMGGASSLGQHLARHDMGAQEFPTYELIDPSGRALQFDGSLRPKAATPRTDVDGWIRQRPLILPDREDSR